jgi:hypothetical protein
MAPTVLHSLLESFEFDIGATPTAIFNLPRIGTANISQMQWWLRFCPPLMLAP